MRKSIPERVIGLFGEKRSRLGLISQSQPCCGVMGNVSSSAEHCSGARSPNVAGAGKSVLM